MLSNFSSRRSQLLVLILLGFIWGSTFILIKKSLIVFNSIEVGALRIFITGVSLLPFALKKIKSLSKKNLWYIVLSGIVGSGIPVFLFTFAQKHISSFEASIYNALTPLFTLLIAAIFFNISINIFNIIGIIIGLAGSFLLIYQQNPSLDIANNVLHGILLILATIMYGFNTNHVKYNLKDVDALSITSIAFSSLIIPVSVFIFNSTFFSKFQHPYFYTSILYVFILSIVGTAFAMIIWNRALKFISAISASTVTYIIPVFAFFWGIFDGEYITIFHGISILCIFTGIYLVNYK